VCPGADPPCDRRQAVPVGNARRVPHVLRGARPRSDRLAVFLAAPEGHPRLAQQAHGEGQVLQGLRARGRDQQDQGGRMNAYELQEKAVDWMVAHYDPQPGTPAPGSRAWEMIVPEIVELLQRAEAETGVPPHEFAARFNPEMVAYLTSSL